MTTNNVAYRFNSVVFTTVATNAYTGVVAPESFLVQPSYTMPDNSNYDFNRDSGYTMFNERVKYIHTHANAFRRLEKVDCIKAYGQSFITAHHDLILVTSNNSLTNGGEPVVIPFEIYFHTNANNARFYSWICGSGVAWCDIRNVIDKVRSSEWRVEDQPIDYCLAETVPEQCTLNFNTPIMIVTLICNIIKAMCMCSALFLYKHTGHSVLLATLGDAAESFLRFPDETTSGLCIASKKTFCAGVHWSNLQRPQRWTDKQYRWSQAVPKNLWVSAAVVYLLPILLYITP